jgi:hypothetical protein
MNFMHGTIPSALGLLPVVEELYLSNNHLFGTIPPQLGELKTLHKLSLYDNSLTGTVPPTLGQLTNLIKLYLDHNQLTGSVPPSLGLLTTIQCLYLFKNKLTGIIPREFGNLKALRTLYLDHNSLRGSIPAELAMAMHLSKLYVHRNRVHTHHTRTYVHACIHVRKTHAPTSTQPRTARLTNDDVVRDMARFEVDVHAVREHVLALHSVPTWPLLTRLCTRIRSFLRVRLDAPRHVHAHAKVKCTHTMQLHPPAPPCGHGHTRMPSAAFMVGALSTVQVG